MTDKPEPATEEFLKRLFPDTPTIEPTDDPSREFVRNLFADNERNS
jgi:hypothetical protein